jgi:hypothetical protein
LIIIILYQHIKVIIKIINFFIINYKLLNKNLLWNIKELSNLKNHKQNNGYYIHRFICINYIIESIQIWIIIIEILNKDVIKNGIKIKRNQ